MNVATFIGSSILNVCRKLVEFANANRRITDMRMNATMHSVLMASYTINPDPQTYCISLSMYVIVVKLLVSLAYCSTTAANPLINSQRPSLVTEANNNVNQTSDLPSAPSASSVNNSTDSPYRTVISTSLNTINGSLGLPKDWTQFEVPRTSLTMFFHDLGREIGINGVVETISGAIVVITSHIARGEEKITYGYFDYTQVLANKHQIRLGVGDFREIGRPMTWYLLLSVVRGIGDFMMQADQKFTEARFEIDKKTIGYVGTGYIEQIKPAPRPSPTSRAQ